MDASSHVPPGFRFHPTDEELVDYYLRKKVASNKIDLDVIKDVDLYRIEPWDLQELCKIGHEEQSEWYFFSHKDKKYPTGTRTNRATKAGFWKATGRDKAIYTNLSLIGMRKTLVFYKGRAPNGQKSDWIMHEYRLETNENATPQEEGWVVCRAFRKKLATTRKGDLDSLCWYDDQPSFMQDFDSPRQIPQPYPYYNPHFTYSCKEELELQYNNIPHDPFLQLPQLQSPKIQQNPSNMSCDFMIPYANFDKNHNANITQSVIARQEEQSNPEGNDLSYDNNTNGYDQTAEQVTDWRVLDKFVASQLSQGDSSSRDTASIHVAEHMNVVVNDPRAQENSSDLASISTASSQVDMWK